MVATQIILTQTCAVFNCGSTVGRVVFGFCFLQKIMMVSICRAPNLRELILSVARLFTIQPKSRQTNKPKLSREYYVGERGGE